MPAKLLLLALLPFALRKLGVLPKWGVLGQKLERFVNATLLGIGLVYGGWLLWWLITGLQTRP